MNTVQRHGLAPVQRRIALVEGEDAVTAGDDRSQHAMRLLDTMLWVLKGTTRDSWATSAPDEADIVVVHRGNDASHSASWRARGKLVVEVTTDARVAAAGEHVLMYPFPAKRVLELLENLSGQLDSRQPDPSATLPNKITSATPTATASVPATAARADRWSLCEALRTLREVRNDSSWMVARDGNEPVLWLRGDGGSCFAIEALMNRLRDGALIARLELRDGYPPPKSRVVERPGAELFWYAGYNADASLAPWLNPRRGYRVTAWPDFGAIRPAAEAVRVVALLTREPLDLQSLATRARVSLEVAQRTLNALSLCEVLSGDDGRPVGAEPARAASPKGGITGFLSRLRRHLKIGVS